jgi:hypothetical protein
MKGRFFFHLIYACTREFFLCRKKGKREKDTPKMGEVARQRKLFREHFLPFFREREGKKS